MLSIKSMTGTGVGEYYLSLAREDYYLEGGEPPGEWIGAGAHSLGLTSLVNRESLRATLNGFSAKTGEALAQNAGTESRHSGWDLTFSAPKSVSVLWALSDYKTRKLVEEAHKGAVSEVMAILESHGITTRRGKGGTSVERGKLVAASFLHGTSRALDPQLHSHVLVSNVCERDDGTWGTIVGRELFKKKMALGALYRAELSNRLGKQFELTWSKEGNLIEIKQVRKELLNLFAKRREAIKKLLEERGESSARQSERAALDSRKAKKISSRSSLYEDWSKEADTIGMATLTVKERSSGEISEKPWPIFKGMLEKLVESQSYFSEWDVIRHAAEASLGSCEGAKALLLRAKTYLANEREVLHLGDERKERIFTTQAMYRAEEELLSLWKDNQAREFVRGIDVKKLAAGEGLNAEQEKALVLLAEGRALSLISGMAGTGKSRLLRAARTLYEKSTLKVLGTALSGKAAEGLEIETGIPSRTLHKLLSEIKAGEVKLDKRSVVIVDEAGMVGTLMLKELSDSVVKAGARLALVGDEKQLQPISAGGPFQALKKKFGGVLLALIRRQRSSWDRERILELVRGSAERAFAQYAEKGRLKVGEDGKGTIALLLKEWSKEGVVNPELNLILASENSKVDELNADAQELRIKSGKLGSVSLVSKGRRFFIGDRVLFTQNSKLIGVKNGSLGRVIEVNKRDGRLRVELDSGTTVRFRLAHFDHVKLGYAVTTHKAQGLTAENVFVHLGGSLQDREISYVQASRARGLTSFFVSKDDAGENLKRIAYLASESHVKKLAVQIKAELKGAA